MTDHEAILGRCAIEFWIKLLSNHLVPNVLKEGGADQFMGDGGEAQLESIEKDDEANELTKNRAKALLAAITVVKVATKFLIKGKVAFDDVQLLSECFHVFVILM